MCALCLSPGLWIGSGWFLVSPDSLQEALGILWPSPCRLCTVHTRDIPWTSGSGGQGLVILGPTGLKQLERQFMAGNLPGALPRQHTESHPQASCGHWVRMRGESCFT